MSPIYRPKPINQKPNGSFEKKNFLIEIFYFYSQQKESTTRSFTIELSLFTSINTN
jgi:hypothetical protein